MDLVHLYLLYFCGKTFTLYIRHNFNTTKPISVSTHTKLCANWATKVSIRKILTQGRAFWGLGLQRYIYTSDRCLIPKSSIIDSKSDKKSMYSAVWEEQTTLIRHCSLIHRVSKNKQNYICYNYVKLPPHLTFFRTKMANCLKIIWGALIFQFM